MDCVNHSGVTASAFCQNCGKALCSNCVRHGSGGQVLCEPCNMAWQSVPNPFAAPPSMGAPNPAAAAVLGLIPGVGAMYNGQFMKGFVHVVIFVLLIIASSNVSGWFGPLIAFWIFYMAFDAYKTAQAKMLGLPLPDPLGLDKLFGIQESSAPAVPFAAPASSASAPVTNVAAATSPAPVADQPVADSQQTPVGAIVLIALGVLFLLGNIGIFNLHRMWPLFLIGLGLWIAYKHMSQTQGMQGGR